MGNKNTEAHTGHIKHPFCHNKAHGEEEIGRRNKGQDYQRQGLKKRDKTFTSVRQLLILNHSCNRMEAKLQNDKQKRSNL